MTKWLLALALIALLVLFASRREGFTADKGSWLAEYDMDWIEVPAWLEEANREGTSTDTTTALATFMFTTGKPVLVAIEHASSDRRLVVKVNANDQPTQVAAEKAAANTRAETYQEVWAIIEDSNKRYQIRSAHESGVWLWTDDTGLCSTVAQKTAEFGNWIFERAPGTNKFFIRTKVCDDGKPRYLGVTSDGKLDMRPQSAKTAAPQTVTWEFKRIMGATGTKAPVKINQASTTKPTLAPTTKTLAPTTKPGAQTK